MKQLRVWGAIVRNYLPALRPHKLHPKMLFHYSITSSYASILETDYNFHKSNSTYFADLDVARTQCVTHLMKPGLDALAGNAKTRVVRDKAGTVVKGGMGIGFGAVYCSFKREVAPMQGYEMWTRVLSWDRKWLYLVTHYVVKGKVKPTGWDSGSVGWFGPLRGKKTEVAVEGSAEWEKWVIATAVSKYVFKVGRFTVHPTIVMAESGLLPERPSGWTGGANEVGDEAEDLGEVELSGEEEWDWKKVEYKRREGMKYAEKFAALDGLHATFDGGENGALGRFLPG